MSISQQRHPSQLPFYPARSWKRRTSAAQLLRIHIYPRAYRAPGTSAVSNIVGSGRSGSLHAVWRVAQCALLVHSPPVRAFSSHRHQNEEQLLWSGAKLTLSLRTLAGCSRRCLQTNSPWCLQGHPSPSLRHSSPRARRTQTPKSAPPLSIAHRLSLIHI